MLFKILIAVFCFACNNRMFIYAEGLFCAVCIDGIILSVKKHLPTPSSVSSMKLLSKTIAVASLSDNKKQFNECFAELKLELKKIKQFDHPDLLRVVNCARDCVRRKCPGAHIVIAGICNSPREDDSNFRIFEILRNGMIHRVEDFAADCGSSDSGLTCIYQLKQFPVLADVFPIFFSRVVSQGAPGKKQFAGIMLKGKRWIRFDSY